MHKSTCNVQKRFCAWCSQSTAALSAAEAAQAGPSSVRNDPWSIRMREKYGLDTSQFSYDPTREQRPSQPNAEVGENTSNSSSRRCTIM